MSTFPTSYRTPHPTTPSPSQSLGSELDSNELEAAMACLDTDGTGMIKYGEFYTWWKETAP